MSASLDEVKVQSLAPQREADLIPCGPLVRSKKLEFMRNFMVSKSLTGSMIHGGTNEAASWPEEIAKTRGFTGAIDWSGDECEASVGETSA